MPSNRDEFIQYCLRKLGEPVIEINVAPEQVEDRVDEALKFWRDYHYDGSESTFLKHVVDTADLTQGYIQAPIDLLGVTRLYDMSSGAGITSLLDYEYQAAFSALNDIASFNISDYYFNQSHLSLIRETLVGRPILNYNRHSNKIFTSNLSTMRPGHVLVFEVWIAANGPDIWNDRWLQNYTTALIKEQWGMNMSKYQGIQLMGGIAFNGEQILQDATNTKKELEEAVINSFGPMISFYMG